MMFVEFRLVSRILLAMHEGVVRKKDIHDYLGNTSSGMTKALNALMDDGYIEQYIPKYEKYSMAPRYNYVHYRFTVKGKKIANLLVNMFEEFKKVEEIQSEI